MSNAESECARNVTIFGRFLGSLKEHPAAPQIALFR